jgi:hypothetical protein
MVALAEVVEVETVVALRKPVVARPKVAGELQRFATPVTVRAAATRPQRVKWAPAAQPAEMRGKVVTVVQELRLVNASAWRVKLADVVNQLALVVDLRLLVVLLWAADRRARAALQPGAETRVLAIQPTAPQGAVEQMAFATRNQHPLVAESTDKHAVPARAVKWTQKIGPAG